MFLAFYTLTILSGCQSFDAPHRISLVTARVETLGPNWFRSCRRCDDCIPHRPFTSDYYPECDYLITEHTAQRCAFRGLSDYRAESGQRVSHHFKMGFIAAYEDLALNRRPVPRVVPPPKYWNAYYRSRAGQPCVDDWFAGYEAGLDMGWDCGVSRFHEVDLRRGGCDAASTSRFDYGQSAQVAPIQPQSISQAPLTPTPALPAAFPNAYGPQGR